VIRTERALEIRRSLADPLRVCHELGLDDGFKIQRRGVLIRCPWHTERTPSCSVRLVDDGTIIAHCFSCQRTGDVFDLVAVVSGLDCRRHFPDVLRRAGELAGMMPSQTARHQRSWIKPSHAPGWPPFGEIEELWSSCVGASSDAGLAAWLRSRAIDPVAVELFDLARALPRGRSLPRWARCQGRSWDDGGHRCIVPMFDHTGALRSVRARRLSSDQPKGAPPAGYRLGGLVMADALGRSILTTGRCPVGWPDDVPLRLVVTEGEPDFLTWGVAFSDADTAAPAVIGVVAGCWTDDLAACVPSRSKVIIRTDHDVAGERYARAIEESLGARCNVVRGGAEGCDLCAAEGWTEGTA
jgi:hypothetical protein